MSSLAAFTGPAESGPEGVPALSGEMGTTPHPTPEDISNP